MISSRRGYLAIRIGAALATIWVGCGDDDGAAAGETGPRLDVGPLPTPDTGAATTDTGAATSDTGAADMATVDAASASCAGETCGAGEQCCALDCEGTRGCSASCPDLDCAACEGMTVGVCGGALECTCCPAGGPTQNCVCSTRCASDADCTDAARPVCNRPTFGGMGFCAARDFRCCWECNCASPDTPIATPAGERRIADLRAGDLVYSVDDTGVIVVTLLRVQRVAVVSGHRMTRLGLANGRVLELSAGHPMADGRLAGDVREGELLDGTAVTSSESVPYEHEHTFDVLPASPSGAYYAAGVLVASTMTPPP